MNKKKSYLWINVAIFAAIFVLLPLLFFPQERVPELSYNQFKAELKEGRVQEVKFIQDVIIGVRKAEFGEETPQFQDANPSPFNFMAQEERINPSRKFKVVLINDPTLVEELDKQNVEYKRVINNNWFENNFSWIFSLILIVVLWSFFFKKMGGGSSGGILSVGKSKAKLYNENDNLKVTFKDVAGIDEVIEEVTEVVEFLRNPKKFQKLGGKIPKGFLLVGPPGTGKTLLAKALAGEAGVPFFSLSGSDFVEMFVGVGASRVRDLFNTAKEKSPCIVFIDEIDAIGRSRSRASMQGGNDERENTLNQLLVEMDGFNTDKTVLLIGATNRPDVLDPALLRPGRFDRQVGLDRPDLQGRIKIFEVHTGNMPLDDSIDTKTLAAQTPGFAGAEIANICNEASLLAARYDKEIVEMIDFQNAIERVIAGLEKKNKLINPRERKIVAYHETGHALVGYFLPFSDPVHKVSIIPRGMGALGYTIQMPLEDRYLLSKEELLDRICALLGGRAAEDIIFESISTGASDDLNKATDIAKSIVKVYGMSKKLENISLTESQQNNFLGYGAASRDYSEKTSQIIDEEILKIITESYERAKQVLYTHKDKLEELAQKLLKEEIIERDTLVEILGPNPNKVDTFSEEPKEVKDAKAS
ncbi:MAG: ATP-dependent metallopeptidase FtsH/Yme1/Tma family protein [Calditrichaeota bacterium]|nr:MAG: ATP-dependent metallopeptidase FtsH/Yme1/Tma family protein [Calditrichota bacterium]